MATKMAAVVCLHRGFVARRALSSLTFNVSTSPARSWWWEPSARVSPLNGFAMQRADAHPEARQCRWPASHPFRGNAPPQPFAAPFGARRFSDQVDKDVEEAKAFLLRLRYSPEVADGIITALKSSGALLPTLYAMAGAWEVGLDAGLATLAKAVEMELATKSGTKTVSFFVKIPHARLEFECEGLEGMSLRDVAEHDSGLNASMLGEYLECACSGVMACSTCHVIVQPDWFDKDMLDLSYGSCDTSRLGCQLKLRDDMQGLVVTVPAQANNLMDHIPFPDN